MENQEKVNGTVKNVQLTNDTFSFSGKDYIKDIITLEDDVEYIYNRLSKFDPLKPGDEIMYVPGKDKAGNAKMTGVRMAQGNGASSKTSSGAKSSSGNYWNIDEKIRIDEERLKLDYKKQVHINRAVGLDKAIQYYATYKVAQMTTAQIVHTAEEFANFIQHGAAPETQAPPKEESKKAAPPKKATPPAQPTNDDDDLPF